MLHSSDSFSIESVVVYYLTIDICHSIHDAMVSNVSTQHNAYS